MKTSPNLHRLALLGAGLAWLFLATTSLAVGTRRFELFKSSDFEGGDLQGVAIDSTGKVRAGLTLGKIPASDGIAIWSLLALPDGSLLAGTGNDGKVLRVKDGKVTVLAETKALVVTSLARAWNGAVVMGTLPEGRVFKWEQDKLSELCKLEGTEHVWQVVFDAKSNTVLAATGPQGKLWRIDRTGRAQVTFDAPEAQVMSVAVASDGVVYAGTSDKAKLYRIAGPGRATVLHDFARTEVRAIAIGAKGEVYAVANDITGGGDVPARAPSGGSAGPSRSSGKSRGKGTLYRFSPDGTPEKLLDSTEEHYTSLAIGDDGRPYVGTGAEGRIYSVDDAHNSVLVADTEERQIGALLLVGKERAVAGSDPAVIHPVRGVGGADAVWTSKVLDAGLRARFGILRWVSTGPLELSTRSGNTKDPDDSWSDWSQPLVAPGVVPSPAARYLQVRARFSKDPGAVLSEVEIPFLTDNLRPVITEIEVTSAPKRSATASVGLQESGGPVTQQPDSKVRLSWKVDNEDKDELRYRLQYRMVGTAQWYDLLKPREKLTAASYTWETGDLPEGQYRIRVTASDEPSNPPDRVLSHELESATVLVDNTPPTVPELVVNGRRVRGRVVDGVGPIDRIEMSVVGSEEWVPFFPADGIFDEAEEEIDADLSSLVPKGSALVTVRAYDRSRNSVVRTLALQ